MSENNSTLTAARVRELFDYNPETGILTWKCRPAIQIRAGSVAGKINHGYVVIGIGYKVYQAHRLAWLHFYGTWPVKVIDHINGEKTDNRITNLRDVSVSVNCQNRKTAQSSSTTGLIGVSKGVTNLKGECRYYSGIQVYGKYHALGSFTTPEAAHQVYLEAKRRLHEGCTI